MKEIVGLKEKYRDYFKIGAAVNAASIRGILIPLLPKTPPNPPLFVRRTVPIILKKRIRLPILLWKMVLPCADIPLYGTPKYRIGGFREQTVEYCLHGWSGICG